MKEIYSVLEEIFIINQAVIFLLGMGIYLVLQMPWYMSLSWGFMAQSTHLGHVKLVS